MIGPLTDEQLDVLDDLLTKPNSALATEQVPELLANLLQMLLEEAGGTARWTEEQRSAYLHRCSERFLRGEGPGRPIPVVEIASFALRRHVKEALLHAPPEYIALNGPGLSAALDDSEFLIVYLQGAVDAYRIVRCLIQIKYDAREKGGPAGESPGAD